LGAQLLEFFRRLLKDKQLPKQQDLASRYPKHIAFIMDGNGRWAKQRGLPRTAGHVRGVDTMREIVKACVRLKIPYSTYYAFSTENWRRSDDEVGFLMNLFLTRLPPLAAEMKDANVELKFIGNRQRLSRKLQAEMAKAEELTKGGQYHVFVAVNYGGRAEITEAVKAIAGKVKEGGLASDNIDEQVITDYLMLSGVPDPDLLIRTGGEQRISNFLLWELAYSELFFSKTLWPDFKEKELREIVSDYAKRDRRFGKA
jgi:undecaprenyl diphosphate synthase